MKRLGWIAAWLALFAAFCAVCACGQNTFHVVSAFARPGGQIAPQCQAQVKVLWQTIRRYPHPANWDWYVVCDDAAWEHLLVHLDKAGERIYGLTDLESGNTFLRGTTLLRPEAPEARPEHIVAHELAHVFAQTRDEERAEGLAQRWLRGGELVLAGR